MLNWLFKLIAVWMSPIRTLSVLWPSLSRTRRFTRFVLLAIPKKVQLFAEPVDTAPLTWAANGSSFACLGCDRVCRFAYNRTEVHN